VDRGILAPEEAATRFADDGYSQDIVIDHALRDAEPVDAEGEAEVAPPGEGPAGENVQAQVLNGAQVASLVDVIAKVAAEEIPRDSGVEIIMLAYQVDKPKAELPEISVVPRFAVNAKRIDGDHRVDRLVVSASSGADPETATLERPDDEPRVNVLGVRLREVESVNDAEPTQRLGPRVCGLARSNEPGNTHVFLPPGTGSLWTKLTCHRDQTGPRRSMAAATRSAGC
jgi:hypothetical protein